VGTTVGQTVDYFSEKLLFKNTIISICVAYIYRYQHMAGANQKYTKLCFKAEVMKIITIHLTQNSQERAFYK